MPTSLDQLQQLQSLFAPTGDAIARYGALKFQLDQQQQEEERKAALETLASQRQYTLYTDIQKLKNEADAARDTTNADRYQRQIEAAATLEQNRQDAADKKQMDANRSVFLSKYTAAGGTKKPSEFSNDWDGLAAIQQETQVLEDQKVKDALGGITNQSSSIQSEIERMTAVTPADRKQAAQAAVQTADPTPWYGSKNGAVTAFLTDPNAFVKTYGSKASRFLSDFDREIARIRQNKIDLNKETLTPLVAQLQDLTKVRGEILVKHPDWAANLTDALAPAKPAAAKPAPAADPFAAFLGAKFPGANPAIATPGAPSTAGIFVPAVVAPPAPVVPATPTQPSADALSGLLGIKPQSNPIASSLFTLSPDDQIKRQAVKDWMTRLYATFDPGWKPTQPVAPLSVRPFSDPAPAVAPGS